MDSTGNSASSDFDGYLFRIKTISKYRLILPQHKFPAAIFCLLLLGQMRGFCAPDSLLTQQLLDAATNGQADSVMMLAAQLDSEPIEVSEWLEIFKATGKKLRAVKPDAGREFFSHYTEVLTKRYGEAHHSTATLQSFVAESYYKERRYHLAAPAFEKAIAMFEDAGIRDVFTGLLYHKTANTYIRMWDRPRGISYLRKAYSRFEENNDPARMSKVICDLNIALLADRDFKSVAKAIGEWKSHPATPTLQQGILRIQACQLAFEKNNQVEFETAVQNSRSFFEGDVNPLLKRDFLTIQGRAASRWQQAKKAIALLEQAAKMLDARDRETAKIYVHAGEAALESDQFERAQVHFQTAFSMLQNDTSFVLGVIPPPALNPEPWLMQLYMKSAVVWARKGKMEASLRWMIAALDQAALVRLSQTAEEAQLQIAGKLRPAIFEVLNQTGSSAAADSELQALYFACMMRARGAVLAENTGMNRARKAVLEPEELEKETRLRQQIHSARLNGDLAAAENAQRELELFRFKYLSDKQFTEALRAANQVQQLGEFCAALEENQCAVFYLHGASQTTSLLVSNKAFSIEKQVDTAGVSGWYRYVSTGAGNLKSGHTLYQNLLLPHFEKLPQAPSSLIVAPDGLLGMLPFETLITQPVSQGQKLRDVPWLIKDCAVSYLNHGLKDKPQEDYRYHFAGFAPDYSTRPSLQNLAHNMAEVAESASLFSKKKTWSGQKALTSAFPEAASGSLLLHVAAHGIPDHLKPDNSYLAFADGDISAGNIRYSSIPAQLTTLSACRTGEGKIADAEGILHLGRAFTEAGSQNVVLSLWDTDDEAARTFMRVFYSEIASGKSIESALQTAKLQFLMAGADPLTAHPRFWAPFVLSGEGDTLELPANSKLRVVLTIAFALLLLFIVARKKTLS